MNLRFYFLYLSLLINVSFLGHGNVWGQINETICSQTSVSTSASASVEMISLKGLSHLHHNEKQKVARDILKIYGLCFPEKSHELNEEKIIQYFWNQITVLKYQDEIIGSASLGLIRPLNLMAEAYLILHSFCLDPRFRNLGLGSKLLQELLSQKNNMNVVLRVDEDNKKAQKFYQHHGFHVYGYSRPEKEFLYKLINHRAPYEN
jgi:GNAT superfamily N-acetyltransferase